MLKIVVFSFLAELFSFLTIDLVRQRRKRSGSSPLRLIAVSSGIVLVLTDFIFGSGGVGRISLDFATVGAVLLMQPCSYEDPSLSGKCAAFLAMFQALSLLFFVFMNPVQALYGSLGEGFPALISLTVLGVYNGLSAARRFKGIRLFFRAWAVWHYVEDYTRFLYCQAFACALGYSVCAVHVPGFAGEVMRLAAAIMFMGMNAILYLRSMTGRTLILDVQTENRVKDIIKGNLRTSFVDRAEEDKKMNNLYRKIMILMSEKKPYLDPDFCMNDLAEQVYSNKLYLSRTINLLSGRNFRQFVNYHRVQYAIDLFKQDPRLKVSEASEMSGFHSTVSFNMAFKVNTGKTPSQWLQDHQAERLERLRNNS